MHAAKIKNIQALRVIATFLVLSAHLKFAASGACTVFMEMSADGIMASKRAK